VNQPSLIDIAIDNTKTKYAQQVDALDRFLNAKSLEDMLSTLAKIIEFPKENTVNRFRNVISFYISEIDRLLNAQLDIIIHDKRFQKYEASWRGLRFLTDQLEGSENIIIRVLDVSWRELVKDFDRAIEFDQTQLFKKVYSAEYDRPGGEPYGVLLGDYSIPHRPTEDMPFDNLGTLRQISTVASASFAPFIASAHPTLFGLDNFDEIASPINFEQIFRSSEYIKWNQFRESNDARFIGLTMPRVLMRRPYADDTSRSDGFMFDEKTEGRRDRHLWGNACYAFGAVLVKAFKDHGWFADIRGSYRGTLEGGVVNNLAVDSYDTDAPGSVVKFSTDVLITDNKEKQLSDLGLIPLCHSRNTKYAIFYSNQSVQSQKYVGNEFERTNARLGSMLQYIFCVSRFAHYLKVIGRDKIGSLMSAEECQRYLKDWLMQFSIASETPSYEMRAKHPLSDSHIEVKEIPGKPGVYGCIVQLKPHAQIDQLMSSIKLVTELVAAKV
jgi:type VI secretion system protein ImpD